MQSVVPQHLEKNNAAKFSYATFLDQDGTRL
jgi:hypothetical protein